VTGRRLELAAGENLVDGVEVRDGTAVVREGDLDPGAVIGAARGEQAFAQRNLFGEAERIAARAASTGTRRQYASIFRAFGDWLARGLGRPPVVGDLDADVIAAYARHLATGGWPRRSPRCPGHPARLHLHGPRARPRPGA